MSRLGDVSCVESHEAAGSSSGGALPSVPESFGLANILCPEHKNFDFSKGAEGVIKCFVVCVCAM